MPEQSEPEVSQPPSEADSDDLNLIYKIEGKPNELDVFELARVLDSFGNVLKESYRIAHPNEGEMVVKVKPFETGSFIMDIVLHIQSNPGVLFFLAHPEIIKYTKDVLESVGLIKGAVKGGASLLELLKRLKNGKPEKVEQKSQDEYEFHAGDGAVIPVKSTVHALYNSPVINNYTFNIVAPAEHDSVQDILTYLKSDPETTQVKIGKEDVRAVRAYSDPPAAPSVEVLEDTTTKILHPKSGNYGQTTGTWSFTIAGSKRVIKAKIMDTSFLTKYSSGTIRFYQSDRLKVKLLERQVVEGQKTRMQYEILEVLEYHQAHPSLR